MRNLFLVALLTAACVSTHYTLFDPSVEQRPFVPGDSVRVFQAPEELPDSIKQRGGLRRNYVLLRDDSVVTLAEARSVLGEYEEVAYVWTTAEGAREVPLWENVAGSGKDALFVGGLWGAPSTSGDIRRMQRKAGELGANAIILIYPERAVAIRVLNPPWRD